MRATPFFREPLLRVGLIFAALLLSLLPNRSSTQTLAFRPETSRSLIEAVIRTPQANQLARGGRLRAIRVAPNVPEKRQPRLELATVTLVRYVDGRGVRALVEVGSRRVRSIQMIPGRPQSSEEERVEAEGLISRDPSIARLLRSGGYLVGGFAVDPPAGSGPGRYLEFHVGAGDHRSLLAEVFINMANGELHTRGAR